MKVMTEKVKPRKPGKSISFVPIARQFADEKRRRLGVLNTQRRGAAVTLRGSAIKKPWHLREALFQFFSPPKKETGLSSSRDLASCLGVVSRTKETSRSVEEKWSGVNKKHTHTHKKIRCTLESAFSEKNSDTGCLLLDIASVRLRVSSGILFLF